MKCLFWLVVPEASGHGQQAAMQKHVGNRKRQLLNSRLEKSTREQRAGIIKTPQI